MKDILLIDDDPNTHKIVSCFLRMYADSRFRFHGVFNLKDAMAALRNRAFDIVLLDNRLEPYRDARETLPELNGVIGEAELFVISANADESYAREIVDRGAARVIDKYDLNREIAAGQFC